MPTWRALFIENEEFQVGSLPFSHRTQTAGEVSGNIPGTFPKWNVILVTDFANGLKRNEQMCHQSNIPHQDDRSISAYTCRLNRFLGRTLSVRHKARTDLAGLVNRLLCAVHDADDLSVLEHVHEARASAISSVVVRANAEVAPLKA